MLREPIVASSAVSENISVSARPNDWGTLAAPPFREMLEVPKVVCPDDAVVFSEPKVVLEGSIDAEADLPAVPGYEVMAELGRGGMGVVYLVRQRSLKRLVALKMVLAGAHADPTTRTRFRTETEAVARLSHPNVVQIHEVGEHEGRPFLAMEYVAGGGLDKRIAAAPLKESEAACLVETLAGAVHYTHQSGILHRDLKPSNILLTAEGTPKITDFGLAKLMDVDTGATRTETLIGTPNYMSPEQAAGTTKRIGVPADIYSLGAILYELLTRQAPFRGTSALDTLAQVRTQEPVPPRHLCGSVSRDLETICLKCLEKEPTKRYPSAGALADELHRFLAGEPIQARPIPAWQRAWRAVRRRPGRMAGIAGGLALFCLVLTSWWYASVAGQLAHHRAEENRQKFLKFRNEALFYGLLASGDGARFLGTEATANLQTAESAAREALMLAGIDLDSPPPAVAHSLLAAQEHEIVEDCYTLLLVLASVKERQLLSHPQNIGRYQEALRILETAGKLGIQSRAYHLRHADVLGRSGKTEEALKATDRAAAIVPISALDQFLIGEEHYRGGKFAEASAAFERALVQQPGHFWAQFFDAVCQLKLQQWGTAKTGLNACLARQPDFVWGYLFRSFVHEKLQEWVYAEADFTRAQQLNPNEDARYVLFLTRGIFYFNQRELDRSAADFRAAIALKPDQYNGYLNLAHVCLAQQQFEQAAAQVDKAMRLRPPVQVVVGYHLECSRSLLRDKRYEEALAACQAARELRGDQPASFEIAGRALLHLGRFGKAECSFDEYLQKGGEALPDVYRSRGIARMKLGKYPEAAEDFSRVLERVPDADIYHHRGWAFFFADAWKLALRDFTRAVELQPDLGDAYTGRGLAYVMLGQYQEAVADAEEALRRKPVTPEMMHNVACIYAQAVARVETDSDEKDRHARATEYRRRALEAVRGTLQMLRPEERMVFWRDKILTDSALAAIRQDDGFKQLENSASSMR